MRSIAVINQKGGVGKTTTAVNLSAGLAKQGKRVFLLDLDPQAHASLHLGVAADEDEPSIYDVLTRDASLADVRRKANDNLWLAPAHLDLAAAEMELAGEVGREIILHDKFVEDPEDYDYVILDCPPSLGLLTLNALTAVEEVFLPLQPHFFSLHGLSKLLRTIELVTKRLNQRLRLSGVIFCMYESGTRLAAEVDSDVRQFFASQQGENDVWGNVTSFQTRIRRNIRLAEAPSYGQSIFEYSPVSNGAEDYANLVREVLGEVLSFEEEEPESISHVIEADAELAPASPLKQSPAA